MDFALMGTISSYVKHKNLTFAAKHKIKTGQVLTNANGNFISATGSAFDKLRDVSKVAADKSKQIKLRRIKNKLLSGKKLSEEEMGFLRVNDPKTYKKAMHAEEAREQLKAELKKAKSKEEAQEAMTRALVKASSEAMAELSALGSGGAAMQGGGGNAAMQSGGDMSVPTGGDAMNVSGGEVSADASGAEAQTSADAAQTSGNTQNADQNSTDKTHGSQQTQDDNDTPEDIMEKYIMTIRALEDEWAQFTHSKEYKDLPEHTKDASVVGRKKTYKPTVAPERKFLEAVALYRKNMLKAFE